ncbi:MAG: crotonase/enoyl-CoA hydratase family protein [Nitrospirae bacterium]|nr:crotonase/enoyl-CoA hydratase family protein [Nitrospirota bacterium]
MHTTKIHYELADGIATLRLDDGKANTIESTFIRELNAALDRAEKDAAAVVIVGRAGFFSAGLDLKVLPTLPPDAMKAFVRSFGAGMLRVWQHPRPVVAAITGHAIAGGAVLALACDRRIGAVGTFKIGLSEVAIGLPLPPYVVAMARQVLPPPAWSGAMLFGELYDPLGAVGKGYLDRMVPADQVLRQALEEAKRLAALHEHAFAVTKKYLRSSEAQAAWADEERHLDNFLKSGPLAPRA